MDGRYHVGESMLPSMRHFLRFIGAYEKLDAHGFIIKVTLVLFRESILLHTNLLVAERRYLSTELVPARNL